MKSIFNFIDGTFLHLKKLVNFIAVQSIKYRQSYELSKGIKNDVDLNNYILPKQIKMSKPNKLR